MSPRLGKRHSEEASVLVVTLLIASLVGITIGSYLIMVSGQNRSVVRSQAWNSALAISEAGVEEALAQLNPGAPEPVIDRTANGWGAAVNGLYGPRNSALSNGTYAVVYTDDKYPIIYSTGYVTVPAISATLTRVLRVGTTNVPLFNAAMAARNGINLNGNGIATDSFNSSDPNLSTNGRYDPTKTSTNGTVASFTGIVNVGNADVNGAVLLGPVATDSISKNGIVTGGVRNDFNFEFEDVVLPSALSNAPIAQANPQTINGTNYQYVFTSSGDYQLSSLNGSVYVASNANVRLYLSGNSNPSAIEVGASGTNSGSLAIYMAGASFSVASTVVDGGKAANLSYYGLPSNTSVTMGGNASFTGTIYAPEADFKLGGGGSSTYNFVGACVVNTVTMTGHFNFHYDEAITLTGPVRGYVACSWQEI